MVCDVSCYIVLLKKGQIFSCNLIRVPTWHQDELHIGVNLWSHK